MIDTAYGLTNPSELGLNFFTTDIDKVATAAFKISFNELFALVLLLLVAIIVVISISRPTKFLNQVISFETFQINKELYRILAVA
jgi:glucan phosphoethanolaminetransferase (alkaline phosphatase superfamily)